ncbi:MAG: flagellar hook-associated protein FlgL [Methylomonas sp.]|jgi:flagellar hook-associated protein 3 FlgL|uniref:flagellar hook-associated protein FlgL n=1 Tax=Methylomonas sp. TaxID=418 RepID=UPI0025E9C219|nr:flagellar hook-associated protein FlgL [Methylomonas sp.]MCK9606433.1 flagellar hook-associated protein FlgL [Methylomonas sp.]
MRISTSWSQQLAVDAMLNQQVKLSEAQLKLSSGQKYLKPSENPTAVTGLINLQQNIKENEQYQVNIGVARQRLGLQESSLGNATDTLQRIRELAVQGLNDTNTQENRTQIAAEIDQLNQHLLGLANTQNANGEYLFSGTKSNVPAYSKGAAGYSFDGEPDTRRNIAIGPERTLTDGDPGNTVFGELTPGVLTAGSIGNVFQAVEQLSLDLKNNQPSSNSLTDLDEALKRIETTRASTGARLHALDNQESLNDDYILDNKATASAIGDLDYADAISKFNLQQTSLQAAQQAFIKVQNLSLFNFIN